MNEKTKLAAKADLVSLSKDVAIKIDCGLYHLPEPTAMTWMIILEALEQVAPTASSSYQGPRVMDVFKQMEKDGGKFPPNMGEVK